MIASSAPMITKANAKCRLSVKRVGPFPPYTQTPISMKAAESKNKIIYIYIYFCHSFLHNSWLTWQSVA